MAAPDGPSKSSSIGEVLAQVGISSDFAQKVRFRGPVGKLALIAVFAVMGLGGVGMRSSTPSVQITCAILATFVVISTIAGILWYSHVHPDQATLEGMEVVVLQQQKAAWAAKNFALPLDAPVIPDPKSSPPQLNPPEVPEQ